MFGKVFDAKNSWKRPIAGARCANSAAVVIPKCQGKGRAKLPASKVYFLISQCALCSRLEDMAVQSSRPMCSLISQNGYDGEAYANSIA